MESTKFIKHKHHFNMAKNLSLNYHREKVFIELIKTITVSGSKTISYLIEGTNIKSMIFKADMGLAEAEILSIIRLLPYLNETYKDTELNIIGISKITIDWFYQSFWSSELIIYEEYFSDSINLFYELFLKNNILHFSNEGFYHSSSRMMRNELLLSYPEYKRLYQLGLMNHFQYMQRNGLKARWVSGIQTEQELNSCLLYQGLYKSRVVDTVKMMDIRLLMKLNEPLYNNKYWINHYDENIEYKYTERIWDKLKEFKLDYNTDLPLVIWLSFNQSVDEYEEFMRTEWTGLRNRRMRELL